MSLKLWNTPTFIVFKIFMALVPIATATEQLPNLAEHQPAWQTSTGYDAEASRCVDGDLSIQFASGSCSHTVYPSSVGAVWGVDLENVSDIYYVEVLNRDGGEAGSYDYLTNYYVKVSDTGYPITHVELNDPAFVLCGQYDGPPFRGQFGRVTCSPEPVRGRYVYISMPEIIHLMMCEVRVFGVPVWSTTGYKKASKRSCGYEYEFGILTPQKPNYEVKEINVSHPKGCFYFCNQLDNCTGFKADGQRLFPQESCELLVQP